MKQFNWDNRNRPHYIKLFCCVVAIFIFTAVNYAETGKTAGGALLNGPASARQMGMGGAFVGIADSVSAIQRNPAGLVFLTRPEIVTLYNQSPLYISYSFIGFTQPLRLRFPAGIGFGLTTLQAGDIEVNLTNSDGSFKESKTVKAESDYAAAFSFAGCLNETLSAGANVKMIKSVLAGDYEASSYAADFGLLFRRIDSRMSAGFAYRNKGRGLKYVRVEDPLPEERIIGISYRAVDTKINKLIVAGDIIQDETNYTNIGIEYQMRDIIAFRAGYRFGYELDSFTVGFGIKSKILDVDYAYLSKEEFSNHSISLKFLFGPAGQYNTGRSYFDRGLFSRSISEWEKVSEDSKDYKSARDGSNAALRYIGAEKFYSKGRRALFANDYGLALENYEKANKAIKGYKNSETKIQAIKHINQGISFVNNANYQGALTEFAKAAEITDDNHLRNEIAKLQKNALDIQQKEIQKQDRNRVEGERMERERKTAIYADLEDLSGALQRAKEQSLDTMEQENILARALELYKEGNLELAREKINIVLKSLDKLYEQDALSAIREAEKAVDIARKNKIGTREAEELLKNAKSFFDNADYMSAKRLADQVTTQTKKEIGKKAMATERQRLKELGRKNLAVSNFEGRPPISSSEAAFITDFFRQAFIKAGTFNVLDRSNMEQILAEQGFQQTGCTTEECAVQMGKFLNVHLMVVGSCGKLLSRFIITVNIVDIESGKFIYSDKESCYSEEEIEGMVDKIVGRISTEFQ